MDFRFAKCLSIALFSFVVFFTVSTTVFAEDFSIDTVKNDVVVMADNNVQQNNEAAKVSEELGDAKDTASDETEEVLIKIDEEEVPLYASSTNKMTYVTYVCVVLLGAVVIFGGAYMFFKSKSE